MEFQGFVCYCGQWVAVPHVECRALNDPSKGRRRTAVIQDWED